MGGQLKNPCLNPAPRVHAPHGILPAQIALGSGGLFIVAAKLGWEFTGLVGAALGATGLLVMSISVWKPAQDDGASH